MRIPRISIAAVAIVIASTTSVLAQMNGMNMAMPQKPAHFAATRQAYTTNHTFLVKLVSIPNPIPYEKYFKLRVAVYDGSNTSQRISNVKVSVFAGMRHGMKMGFAHGMQSAPQVQEQDGVATVSGMYFHMMGPWTLKATVQSGNRSGVAYFQLPCCAQ